MRGGFGNGAIRTQFQIKRQVPKLLTRKASKLLCDPSSVFSIGPSVSLIVESTCIILKNTRMRNYIIKYRKLHVSPWISYGIWIKRMHLDEQSVRTNDWTMGHQKRTCTWNMEHGEEHVGTCSFYMMSMYYEHVEHTEGTCWTCQRNMSNIPKEHAEHTKGTCRTCHRDM